MTEHGTTVSGKAATGKKTLRLLIALSLVLGLLPSLQTTQVFAEEQLASESAQLSEEEPANDEVQWEVADFTCVAAEIDGTAVAAVTGLSDSGKEKLALSQNVTIPSGTVQINDATLEIKQVGAGASVSLSTTVGETTQTAASVTIENGIAAVGNNAFAAFKGTSITLPNSLKTIGNAAFAMSGLSSVSIPDSVTTIGKGAFANITSLNNISIGSGIEEIPAQFAMSSGVLSITIPATVKSIGEKAFYNAQGLTVLSFANNSTCTTISKNAFYKTNIQALSVPASVTTIADSAFNASKIQALTFADAAQLQTIGANAFASCSISTLNIPSSVTSIGNGAFSGNKIATFTFPEASQIKTIGKYVFRNNSITSFEVPNFITEIGESAFAGNPLTSLTFKETSSCTTIGAKAFEGNKLEKVDIPASVETLAKNAFVNNPSTEEGADVNTYPENKLPLLVESDTQYEALKDTATSTDQKVYKKHLVVTFDANGGTFADESTATATVEWNTAPSAPSTSPTKENMEFSTWTTEKDGSVEFDFENTKVIEDKTVYAKWVEADKTAINIQFIGQDANKAEQEWCATKVEWSENLIVSEFTESVLNNAGLIFGVIPEDDEWELDLVIKDGVTLSTEKIDHAWNYWHLFVNGNLVTENPANVTLNKGDKVVWKYAADAPITHTVTFDTRGGSAIDAITAYDDEPIESMPDAPTKTNAIFLGWYTDANLTEPFDETSRILQNMKLYASWDQQINVKFSMTAQTSSGTTESWVSEVNKLVKERISVDNFTAAAIEGTGVAIQTSTSEDGVWSFDSATKNGVTLENKWVNHAKTCWHLFVNNKLVSSNAAEVLLKEGDEVKWAYFPDEVVSHQVTFNSNGGSFVNTLLVYGDEVVSKPENPTKEGLHFVGWFSDANLMNEFEFGKELNEDIELYAMWTNVVFADVNDATDHMGHINWLGNAGISTGWPSQSGVAGERDYRPYDEIARCDMAAFLYRAAGSPAYTEPDVSPFTDVDDQTPHYKAVCWLASAKISTGFANGDGTFRFEPYSTVARQDMAAFVYRLVVNQLKVPGKAAATESPFTDVIVGDTENHANEVLWLAANGISTGFEYVPEHTWFFGGLQTCKRCDMAAFIHRALNLVETSN